jgi:tetratricopeptide (TPR) repeat protein
MVTQLTDCYSGHDRYGLHAHVRNWLATKKGRPFSLVMGGEQTAITVIPVIDEEIVPLDREDYRFIWDTVDGLLEPEEGRRAPSQAHIRAAFMLLRGSMRIGTVLRSAHAEDSGLSSERTPLEEYVRRLLDIRHAALACADMPGAATAPLFEREWVWLFNEIGVVKLLQGQAHDASALFEQAIEFESERLHAREGFEALIYERHKLPSFSISKLRVMMNLALAEIERGAFNRASRILSSEKRDLEKLWSLFAREDFPKKQHREIRILQRVLGLIDTRLKFLSGGAGEAIRWLEDSKAGIVGEGVHGLTALYFLIRADVEAGRKNYTKAAEMFSIARAEAQASGRSDMIFSVMLGESELRIISQGRPSALQLQQQLAKIRKIKHEAQRMGMARVVVTACMLRARLYLGLGEYRSARQDLMTALTLSTSNGLNIKRASALIDMAALVGTLDAELRKEAGDIARSARFDAERMGYKLAAARAKDLELVLREQGSIEDWLFRRGAEAASSREESG